MRWSAMLVVLCVAAPVSAQDGDAEKLYRAMEKKVRAAKSLKVVFDGDSDAPTFKGSLKVTLYVVQGNKGRMEMDIEIAGQSFKSLMITDGKVSYQKQGDKEAKVEPNPKKTDQLDKMLPGMMARTGLFGSSLVSAPADPNPPKEFDLDKEFPIKNFKLGAKEMVGNRPAQVVDYQLEVKGKTVKASVWIDTQTQLPLKRVLVLEEGGKTLRATETYSTFVVDAKLDPKLFDIPK